MELWTKGQEAPGRSFIKTSNVQFRKKTHQQILSGSCVFLSLSLSFHGDDLLVKCRSVVDRDHLVDVVPGVQHRDAHQPLDDELRLEEILTLLGQTLQKQHSKTRSLAGCVTRHPVNRLKCCRTTEVKRP